MRSSLTQLIIIFLIALSGTGSVCAQTVTFTGRITNQSTGQGISDVAVVAEGNQTGTRVTLTDAQGNYTLPCGANTTIKLRPYKTTYIFNPVLFGVTSFGGFPISGSITRDYGGSSFPILTLALPPILLTEDNSLNALALDTVNHTRDPFPLTNDNYFGTDKRTRVTLLLVDLDLYPNMGETLSIITAQAVDDQAKSYNLVVEDLRKVPNVPWMSQLTVRLPSELAGVTDVTVTVSARGQVSNGARLKLR
jgi:hypothetical protein